MVSYLENAKLECKKVFLNEFKCIFKKTIDAYANEKILYKDGFRLCYIKTFNYREKVGGKNISKHKLFADFMV